MAAPFTASQIKLETPEAGENITEIQTYLETFNKEIESTDGTTTIATPAGKFFFFTSYLPDMTYLCR